jgi:hypothetical protein
MARGNPREKDVKSDDQSRNVHENKQNEDNLPHEKADISAQLYGM